jgi:hypothetical protein
MVLDERGIVKIIDFGCATVIKYPFEENVHMSKGDYDVMSIFRKKYTLSY